MKKVELTDALTLNQVQEIVFGSAKMELGECACKNIKLSFEFLKKFASDNVIYGINTGFGPMAQYRVEDEELKALQYNIIRSHSTGAGQPLDERCVRALMLARMGTFMQAKSGVDPRLVSILAEFINNEIYPMIPEHGGVGASGDLVQLAHLALTLIGEGEVFYKGQRQQTSKVLAELGIKPFEISLREGLAVTNGTSAMTGIGLVNLIYAKQLLHWSVAASVMMNEIASSYTDFMSDVLNSAKHHNGQCKIAEQMRAAMEGSKRGRDRETELYNGNNNQKVFSHKVQPYYSLRCVPQILGPVYDELQNAEAVLVNELNSVCDNPVVDYKTKNVYHGGNFHGDYVSFEMDKLKIAVTKLTMLTERQLNYLFHDKINGILPPFLNMGVLGLNYGMQACQFTATSTTAECQMLSNPMYVHSIPNNNDNQDIVSMGTNAALITKRVIDNSFQVMAIHMVAIVQAVDCLKIAEELSPVSRELYDKIRGIVPAFIEDTTKYHDIENVIHFLKDIK